MGDGDWGLGNTFARNGFSFLGSFKKQKNPYKYYAGGYDLMLILCLMVIIPNSEIDFYALRE
jgi:hypothetical protein